MDALFHAGFFSGQAKDRATCGADEPYAPLDKGIIYLIDDRFARLDVLRLLPRGWKVEQYKTKETR